MGDNATWDSPRAVHPSAIVEDGSKLGAGARVGPYCHVGLGSVIGCDAVLADHVIIERGVVVGDRATIAPGVFLRAGVVLGDDVAVGPNAVFVNEGSASPDSESTVTTVGNGALIGANASVLAGVSIGPYATVGAGAVVTRDVPPFATVVGSPARIVGYHSTPSFTASKRFRASAVEDRDFPVLIGRATLLRYPRVDDLRGSLTFAEVATHLPFTPQRYFVVFDVPSREVRGEHAHRALHQLLVCVHGECAVAIDDGSDRGEVVLDRPDVALHLPPMVWGSQYRYSSDATLLVLASSVYDDADYIRTYEEFEKEVERG